jgi:aldehyde:ferredoxin oxidoreductase
LPAATARAFLGGRGLGVYLALRERLYDVEPLGPDNLLIFAPGPLTGTGAPASGRYSVTTRSPLTGTVFDANSGGNWGNALRRLGYDYLIVSGVLEAPGVVHIGAERVEFHSADGVWGLDVPSSLTRLGELYPRSESAVIGPAGERGVLFAGIVNNRGRQLGRGGLGAVMGAKRLKALVVDGHGERKPPVADPERLKFIVYEAEKLLKSNPITSTALPEFGTSVLVNVLNQAGALPTRNYRESQFEGAAAICGETLKRDHVRRRTACRGCVIGCARVTEAGGQSGEGPEYETIWAFGADCGVADLTAILHANYACNRAGMDTITMGSTIACAMELTEEGLLPGGPRFGDARAIVALAEATARGEGLGAELGLGSARFAARHGRPELSMSVKGMETPAYDPRGMKAQGLSYATSNRGGCHLRANMLGPEILGVPKMVDRFATLGKAGLLINLQNLNAVLDSLSVCKFTAFAMKEDYYARQLSAVWGETVEPQELLLLGERIWNAERLFNLAAGFGRADDTLAPRLREEPVASGPAKGQVVDLEPMLDEYYVSRGWTAEGVPGRAKLERLGLLDLTP